MTTVITSRRERKKAEIRSHIVATAIELFSRDGIEGVTVDQIAAAADIGKGTIYNYFETKEAIVVAFMVDLERKVQTKIARMAHGRGGLEEVLTEFILFQFRLKKPYHRFVRVFLGQMFSGTGRLFPYLVEMQKAIDPPLEIFFRTLQQRRIIRSDIGLSELIFAFKTLHLGITGLWAIEGPPFRETEKVLRLQMKLFSEGLQTKRL